MVYPYRRSHPGGHRGRQDLERARNFQVPGGGGSDPRPQVWAIAVGRGSGRDCGGARVLLQPTANAGARLDSLAGHELSGLSRRPVVDGLEAAVWVSGESHGRPPPLAAGGGEHHESPARLPAHRQLRAGDLALAATKEQSGRRDFATGIIFGWLLTFIGMANISTPDQTAPRWLRMSKAH